MGQNGEPAPNPTSSCTPDIAIPSASGRTWPTSCTTGASGTLTDTTGDNTLSTQGQTYSNVRINGSLTVLACDVTIRNVEVDAGIPFNSTPDVFPIWLKEPASCGVMLDHVSVITKSAPNDPRDDHVHQNHWHFNSASRSAPDWSAIVTSCSVPPCVATTTRTFSRPVADAPATAATA